MSRWFPWLCFLCLVIPCGKGCASVKIEAVVDDKVLTSLDVDRREHANGFFIRLLTLRVTEGRYWGC
ncbi:hypothetical protein [Anaplasma phagocytophilum]|uniref:hypothetical protein n=1 Tax=Anaplasma phagocytophilum TaxID=948 RepID=UPI001ED9A63A|nr:hypothetical protein [Anaplasma phagocytophilum]